MNNEEDDNYVQVTIIKHENPKRTKHTLFIQKLIDAGYTVEEAISLATKDKDDIINYLKNLHRVNIN